MITNNYPINNATPSFGAFLFLGNSDKVLRTYGPKTMKKFEKLNNLEKRNFRSIEIDHDGGGFIANYNGQWIRQKFYQSPIRFFKKIIEDANFSAEKREMAELVEAIKKLESKD